MYNCLKQEFKRFRGQPVEVITESGMKFCGIDVEADEDSALLIDRKGRLVRLEYRHIEAVIEPQMRLKRLCKDNDCDCDDNDWDWDNDCDCERGELQNRRERREHHDWD